ncbi:class I SAM-dependent methyltransferase [Shimia sp. NS0008-38b]|uniref:hypothetical protein n=1 Tax=Shimia sp. NS0008-38b TaxID=3127653 RepID=UPI0031094A59
MFKFLKSLQSKRSRHKLATEKPEETFSRYYETNKWGDAESASGKGSNLAVTETLREKLPPLLKKLSATSIVDVPCGDFNWMSKVDLDDLTYIGGDIVPQLVEANQQKFGSDNRAFQVINLLESDIPSADVIFTRDCIVHLSFSDATKAIETIRSSEAKWLLMTTFTEVAENEDILTGEWRRLNMCLPPFNFPEPDVLINEGFSDKNGRHTDKSIGLWPIASLPATQNVD